MSSIITAPVPLPSPPPVPEKTPLRTYYAPLVPSPLNPNNALQVSPPTSPPGSPSPTTPLPKRRGVRRTASQTSPTQILLRQKAAAAFRSESLIKAYSNNRYISLGSNRRHASSRNPFLNMNRHKKLTTADTIDILYSLDIDDGDDDGADDNIGGDIGLLSSSNNSSSCDNKPLPPVPVPPPLFSSSSFPTKREDEDEDDQQHREKDEFDLVGPTPYYEDCYGYDKEEFDLENGGGSSFERERATLLTGSLSSLGSEGRQQAARRFSPRRKRRCGGGDGHRSPGVTRLVIHLRRGLVILGIVIMFVLLHGLLRTFGGAKRPPPGSGFIETDTKN
ncbi:hypothetical protein QBC40DRAFT_37672 [Triangularia verruculosa]|uniref:Uncharacterized protein n=1 Tax=Triangularia verruculosa TaxID=2587418 RepID=A0AAN7AXR6_9PEZI|nr:hypothetical protein QBC40DRAFT_37672 [Triangularia verruculosa]